jgi:hypothetical protein
MGTPARAAAESPAVEPVALLPAWRNGGGGGGGLVHACRAVERARSFVRWAMARPEAVRRPLRPFWRPF